MGETTTLASEIETLVRRHGDSRESLMPILQDLNRHHSYVAEEAMALLSKALNVPRAEIYGVVTFYSFLSAKPRGRYIIRLCRTISCDMKREHRPATDALLRELGVGFGETTPDGLFTLEHTNCIGMCDQGPAMLVNEDVHIRLTEESVIEILNAYRTRASANALVNA